MSRRAVLGAAATASAIGALAGLGGRAGARQSLSIDADTLVEGNGTFTVAVEGVPAAALSEATVSVGGVAFASVEVVEGSPPLLVIEVSSLLGEERIQGQDSVAVEVGVESDGNRLSATDEVRAVTGL